MIASEHVYLDSSRRALSDGVFRFKPRGVVETSEPKQCQILFDLFSWDLDLVVVRSILALCNSHHTKALLCQASHLLQNFVFHFGGDCALIRPSSHGRAQVDDSFNSPLAVDIGVVLFALAVDDRHTLDGTIKRVLSKLCPALLFLQCLLAELKAVGKHLESDFSGISNRLPLVLLLVQSDASQVTEGGRLEELLKLCRDLGDFGRVGTRW